MKRWLPFLVFIVLIGFLYVSLGLNPKKLPSPLIGKDFPAIMVSDFSTNKPLNSRTAILGAPVLVNVWASWCITCLAEHPVLLTLAESKKIRMVGINYKDSKKDAKQFLKQGKNPFELILFDPKGTLGLELGVYATPETFIINASGTIIYKHIGELTTAIIDSKIKPLIDTL